MKKIANIVTTNNRLNVGDIYNVCRSIDNIEIGLPTLIIGYEYASEVIENFSILEKEYPEQNLYWTFKKTEKRDEYEADLLNFCNMSILETIKGVKYEYIDLVNMPFNRVKKMVQYLCSKDSKTILLLRGFVFIYSDKYKITWGLSTELCEFFGVSKSKIINKLACSKSNKLIKMEDIDDELKKVSGNNLHLLAPLYHQFM